MLDTKGREIRLGLFDEPVEVVSGQAYTFSTVETPGTAEKCFVNYAELPADVKSGDMLSWTTVISPSAWKRRPTPRSAAPL